MTDSIGFNRKHCNDKYQTVVIPTIVNGNSHQIHINSQITSRKFQITLSKCNSKSLGPDGDKFSFIHCTPNTSSVYFLKMVKTLYNMWVMLLKWKHNFIMSVMLKQGKIKPPTFDIANYLI